MVAQHVGRKAPRLLAGRSTLAAIPLALLPAGAWLLAHRAPAWLLMWALSIAIYCALKWLTWWRARAPFSGGLRSLGYLTLWPGMDAPSFLDPHRSPGRPRPGDLAGGLISIVLGAALLWGLARFLIQWPLLAGWIGLFGLIFLLHFGAFRVTSVFWRSVGVDAAPLMVSPLLARSLGDFWGRRWNTAFHVLARDFLVAPLRPVVGAPAAVMLAFLASGLVHDLVISVPARGGFGLPTAYFLLQGLGLLAERSSAGRAIGLGRGLRGRVFAILVAGGPAFALFHPAFVLNVMVPFMRFVGAA